MRMWSVPRGGRTLWTSCPPQVHSTSSFSSASSSLLAYRRYHYAPPF
jgi:hypothetical protein